MLSGSVFYWVIQKKFRRVQYIPKAVYDKQFIIIFSIPFSDKCNTSWQAISQVYTTRRCLRIRVWLQIHERGMCFLPDYDVQNAFK